MEQLRRMRRNSRAAVMAEYGLLAGLISVVAIMAVTEAGYHVEDTYDEVAITLAANLGEAVAPEMQTFAQASNGSEVMIGYSEGKANYRDCWVEYDAGSGWERLESVDCETQDGPVTLQYASLPDPWSSVQLRLTAYGGRMVLAQLGAATCNPRAPSAVSTPTVDENCNGEWDEPARVQQIFQDPRVVNAGTPLPVASGIADRFCATRGYGWALDPDRPVESYFTNTTHIRSIASATSNQRATGAEYLIRSVACLRPDYFN